MRRTNNFLLAVLCGSFLWTDDVSSEGPPSSDRPGIDAAPRSTASADPSVSPPASSRPDVLLIVIDTLRHDAVFGDSSDPRRGMPLTVEALSTLVAFTNCQTQSSWTRPSMATLFTSLYPTAHGALRGHGHPDRDPDRSSPDDPLRASLVTLAEVLSDADYRTIAIQTNPQLFPSFGVAQGFDHYRFQNHAPAEWVTDAALEWIERSGSVRTRGRASDPLFVYVHYMDPHTPYLRHEDQEYSQWVGLRPDGASLERLLAGNFTDREVARQRELYRGEVTHTDREIARLLTRLGESPRWRDALVILTSDHGEEFWEHGGFEHGHSLHDEILRVPLLIGGPWLDMFRMAEAVEHEEPGGISPIAADSSSSRVAGSLAASAGSAVGSAIQVVPSQVRLLDVMPTILDLIFLDGPTEMQGASLVRELTEEGPFHDRVSFAEGILYGSEQWSCRDAHWKRIVKLDTGLGTLYRTGPDPDEETDVAAEEHAVSSGIDEQMVSWHKENRAISARHGAVEATHPDAQQLERLRSIGYAR